MPWRRDKKGNWWFGKRKYGKNVSEAKRRAIERAYYGTKTKTRTKTKRRKKRRKR